MKFTTVCCVAFFAAAGFFQYSHADVTITNLGSDSAWVAKRAWYPGGSKLLNARTKSGSEWKFSGWAEIKPGQTYRANDNSVLCVKFKGKPITWEKLATSRGYIKDQQKFGFTLRKNAQAQDNAYAMEQGFESVTYQHFKTGNYNIYGDRAYRLACRTFEFKHQSRRVKFINDAFTVNGCVVYFEFNADNRWACNINWRVSDNQRSVCLDGSVEGQRLRRFGLKRKGYYTGSVKVWYTVRN